jgi:chemotaxis protein CheC
MKPQSAQYALNARQTDALTELASIAFGLTAAKLSEISGCRVTLGAPNIGIHPIHALARDLRPFVTGPVASVHQLFSGPISGDAIMFLNYESAAALSNLLVEEHLRGQRSDSTTSEILTEIGNMLLGTCIGSLGNLLEVRVSFSMPRLHVDSPEHFLTSLFIGGGGGSEPRHAVVMAAPFRIRAQGVDGQFVIVLGLPSLERWILAVDRWDYSQS